MFKDRLLSTETTSQTNVLEFVAKLRERLQHAHAFAQQVLQISQDKMKIRFDRSAVARNFEVGDQVLVLLPTQGSSLSACFIGPYEVLRQLSDTNYVIGTPGRRHKTHTYHINVKTLSFSRHRCRASAFHCSSF